MIQLLKFKLILNSKLILTEAKLKLYSKEKKI